MGFPGVSGKRNCLPVQQMQVRSLGQEDALETEMAAYSVMHLRKLPWTEGMAGYSPCDHKTVGHDLAINNNRNIKHRNICINVINIFK